MRTIYCLPVLLVLAGCASQDQTAARQTAQQATANHGQDAARQADRQVARNHADDAQCRQDRGAPGSNAYLACRVNMANNRQADEGQADANR
jgi:hypothetical protein